MSVGHARARLAAISRHRPGDPQIPTLRRELEIEVLAQRIRQTVDAAPPLSPEQRARLAVLLNPDAA